jgi:hypothetical protein
MIMAIRKRRHPKVSKGLRRRRLHNIDILKKLTSGYYQDSSIAIMNDKYLGELASYVKQEAKKRDSKNRDK